MKNTKREIECLNRLQELSPMYENLVQFLVQEHLMSKDELLVIKGAPERARLLQAKLATLSEGRQIQLLEYEWNLLPVERILITIVSNAGHREFIAEV